MRSLALSICLLMLGCGDDTATTDAALPDGTTTDVGEPVDAPGGDTPAQDVGLSDAGAVDSTVADSALTDTGPQPDASPDDAAAEDARSFDAGTRDAAGACHPYDFGRGPATLVRVDSLPPMTGGVIPMGTYDAIEARTTGMLSGTYRGTWVFESDTVVQTLDQITLSGAPPTPVPHTENYRTSGAGLTRIRVCGGDQTFDNQYRVRVEVGLTYLDVRSGGLVFTFQKRED